MGKLELIKNKMPVGMQLLDITYNMARNLLKGMIVIVDPNDKDTPAIPYSNYYNKGEIIGATVMSVERKDENSVAVELAFKHGIINGHEGRSFNTHNRYFIYINRNDSIYI